MKNNNFSSFLSVLCMRLCFLVFLLTPVSAQAPDSPFGFQPAQTHLPGYPDNGHTDAEYIRVRWTRPKVAAAWTTIQPDLGQQVYDFSGLDPWVTDVPTTMFILSNIAPELRHQSGRCVEGTWIPVDIPKDEEFVRATVERYDGDGIGEGDFPGGVTPNPIRTWQVGNEPQMNRRTDFATLQEITYDAIKDACPTATVVIGGNPGFPDRYIQAFDDLYAPILVELAGNHVDVFDFHWCSAQLVRPFSHSEIVRHVSDSMNSLRSGSRIRSC